MTDSTLRGRVWTCLVAATINVSTALVPHEQVNHFSLLVAVGLLLDATIVWRVLRSIPSADNPGEFESLTKLQIRGVHAIGIGSLGLMLGLHLLNMLHVQGALFVLCGWVLLGVAHRVLGIAFEKRVAELQEAD